VRYGSEIDDVRHGSRIDTRKVGMDLRSIAYEFGMDLRSIACKIVCAVS